MKIVLRHIWYHLYTSKSILAYEICYPWFWWNKCKCFEKYNICYFQILYMNFKECLFKSSQLGIVPPKFIQNKHTCRHVDYFVFISLNIIHKYSNCSQYYPNSEIKSMSIVNIWFRKLIKNQAHKTTDTNLFSK